MTELPELPPLQPRTRPLPPGGLDAVMTGGRRRRQRALAVGGGTTMALVLAVAAVVALPGSGSDELSIDQTFATPQPTATATAAPALEETAPPAPVPTVLATEVPGLPSGAPSAPPPAGDPLAAPRALAGGPAAQSSGGGPVSGGEPSSAAAPQATSGPARPVAERPAYVEDTDEDASGAAGCTATTMGGTTPGAPDGTGSTTTGGACTYSSGFSTGEVVRRGGQAQVVLGYCVGQGGEDDVWQFAGGQEKDVIAVDQNGLREVFRFSSTVRYVEGAHEVRLRPGKCVQWTGRWDLVTTDGRPVPAGEYSLSMTVKADRFLPAYQEPRGFEETITTTIRVVD